MNKPAAQWTLASVVTKKVALAQVDDNAAMMMEEVVVQVGSGEEQLGCCGTRVEEVEVGEEGARSETWLFRSCP